MRQTRSRTRRSMSRTLPKHGSTCRSNVPTVRRRRSGGRNSRPPSSFFIIHSSGFFRRNSFLSARTTHHMRSRLATRLPWPTTTTHRTPVSPATSAKLTTDPRIHVRSVTATSALPVMSARGGKLDAMDSSHASVAATSISNACMRRIAVQIP